MMAGNKIITVTIIPVAGNKIITDATIAGNKKYHRLYLHAVAGNKKISQTLPWKMGNVNQKPKPTPGWKKHGKKSNHNTSLNTKEPDLVAQKTVYNQITINTIYNNK